MEIQEEEKRLNHVLKKIEAARTSIAKSNESKESRTRGSKKSKDCLKRLKNATTNSSSTKKS